MMASNIGTAEITVVATVIDNPMRQFAEAGWSFHYDKATRFVGASHPLGGAFSVCEVTRFLRSGGKDPITFDEVGDAIAAWFNQTMQPIN